MVQMRAALCKLLEDCLPDLEAVAGAKEQHVHACGLIQSLDFWRRVEQVPYPPSVEQSS